MTFIIIIITTILTFTALNRRDIQSKLIFHPYSIKHRKEFYRFLTSGFLHADFLHFFINMFVLFSFGQAVEQYYGMVFGETKGQILFVMLYVSSIIASSISTYNKYQEMVSYQSLGASGAVSAVLFASIVFNPYSKIYLYGIIGIPGIIAGIGYIAYSYYAAQRQNDNINHEAHLYGAIYGLLFTIVFKPSLGLYFLKQLFFLN